MKSRRRRKQRKKLLESGRGLWDYDAYEIDILGEEPVILGADAYEIDILGEEPVILGDDAMTDDERLQHKIEEFSNNFLRTGIINWKNKARDEDNYVKYVLDEMPENITNVQPAADDTVWIRVDKADLATEASSLLGDLTDEAGKKYWIDKRLLGPKWRGLFNATKADDKIRIMELPE